MIVAGVDEAGRGPLAGPVFAAAVILSDDKEILGLNDSKKLSSKKREILADKIKRNCLAWSISQCSTEEIDKLNILNASLLAMKRSIEDLILIPDLVLIDGTYAPNLDLNYQTVVKGDESEKSIMAASILAKTARDNFMLKVDKRFPEYGFKNHKGYPTKKHLEALKSYGITVEHRKSFKPVKKIYESSK